MSLDTHNSSVKLQAVRSQPITYRGIERSGHLQCGHSGSQGEGGLGPGVGFGICGGVCPELDSWHQDTSPFMEDNNSKTH